jgi:hypothetical protein
VQGGGENDILENPNGTVKEAIPNTEVVTKAKRKRFTAAEKLRILREVEELVVGQESLAPC